jgi:hypothetical protein
VNTFKKVKTLTSGDASVLIQAIKTSSFLQLNDDDTKMRKSPKDQIQAVADVPIAGSAPVAGQSRALVLALKDPKLDKSIYVVS